MDFTNFNHFILITPDLLTVTVVIMLMASAPQIVTDPTQTQTEWRSLELAKKLVINKNA